MTLKEIMFAILSALLPLLYTAITNERPDFPMDLQSFIATVLWLVGLPFGGWQLLKGRLTYNIKKSGVANLGPHRIKAL